MCPAVPLLDTLLLLFSSLKKDQKPHQRILQQASIQVKSARDREFLGYRRGLQFVYVDESIELPPSLERFWVNWLFAESIKRKS